MQSQLVFTKLTSRESKRQPRPLTPKSNRNRKVLMACRSIRHHIEGQHMHVLPLVGVGCVCLFDPKTEYMKCTQNQLTVQGYTKPVYCTSVHRHRTSLWYKCKED